MDQPGFGAGAWFKFMRALGLYKGHPRTLSCSFNATVATRLQGHRVKNRAPLKRNKRILKGFIRINGFYAFRPFWPLKPLKTTLKEVLEVPLEVLEVVLEVLQLLLERFLKNIRVTLPKSPCS